MKRYCAVVRAARQDFDDLEEAKVWVVAVASAKGVPGAIFTWKGVYPIRECRWVPATGWHDG